MPLKALELVRSHALGNDYLVVDQASFGIPLTEAHVRLICDRHEGVGSDGILALVPAPPGFGAAVRIFNPDGSEAEKSGNGVRIFAKLCFDHGYADPAAPLRIHTLGGPVEARLLERDAHRSILRVSMGRVSFAMRDLPMVDEAGSSDGEWVERRLSIDATRGFSATCLSVGNPHAVLFDAPFSIESAQAIGPLVERHVQFPRRINMQLAQVVDRHTVRALIWERGAGYTRSSGSSACAVAAACLRAGLVDRDVSVVMPGGTLAVSISADWELEQTGHAEEICAATLSRDLVARLSAL